LRSGNSLRSLQPDAPRRSGRSNRPLRTGRAHRAVGARCSVRPLETLSTLDTLWAGARPAGQGRVPNRPSAARAAAIEAC